jgi:trigger factor
MCRKACGFDPRRPHCKVTPTHIKDLILKIEKQLQDDHQVKLIVEVEPERMEANKRRAARKLAERGKIPGFRPGKAPYDVIRLHYGDEAIIEQAVDFLVDEVYPKALEEADVKPAAPGALESVDSLEPPKFTFVIPMLPTVELGDYKSIRLPYKYKEPTKAKVDEAIEELQRMYATTETVEQPAAMGNYVMADVKGEMAKPKEGEDLSKLSRDGAAFLIRKDNKDDEWPYPGFSLELVGLKPGDSKTASFKYPKDYDDKLLAGQTVKYDVKVNTVRSVTLPELDDEFVKMVGEFENMDALREAVKKDLEARTQAEYDDDYFVELIDKIKSGATIKYPPQVLEHESEHVIEDLRRRLSSQGLDLETYVKVRNTSMDKFMEEEVQPVAVKRLERSLILDEIARAEKIEVDEESLNQEFGQTLTEMQYQGADLTKIGGGKRAQKEFAEAVAMESANRLMTRRTMERLKAIALGEAGAEEKSKKSAAKKSEDSGDSKPAAKPKKRATTKKAAGTTKSAPKASSVKKKTPAAKKPGSTSTGKKNTESKS